MDGSPLAIEGIDDALVLFPIAVSVEFFSAVGWGVFDPKRPRKRAQFENTISQLEGIEGHEGLADHEGEVGVESKQASDLFCAFAVVGKGDENPYFIGCTQGAGSKVVNPRVEKGLVEAFFRQRDLVEFDHERRVS